jgi:subtilisin family serine protease
LSQAQVRQKGIGMQRRFLRGAFIALLFFVQGNGPSLGQQTQKWQRILIGAQKPYDSVVRAVEAGGGRVTQQFKCVDAIAAEVLEEAIPSIAKLPGVQPVTMDVELQKPVNFNPTRTRASQTVTGSSDPLGEISSTDVTALATGHPQAYSINNAGTRIELLHAMGLTGDGVIVAVVDSGMRTGFKLADQAVIGGIDFVDDGAPGPAGDSQSDWKKESNDGHGTFVAGLIAGKESFLVNGVLKSALEQYAPGAIVDGKLPLIGTAPDAGIYVVRVFGQNATATGATVGTILAALDHIIDQRTLFDSTQGKKGLKIQVANLSFGISTQAAGLGPLDTCLDKMLTAGIVPVVSVGDAGPSAITTASPGTSLSAITVGGTDEAANERIMNEVLYATQFPDEYYPGIGGDIRPFGGREIVYFSARGPNADGRLDPDIVASGLGNVGQGYCPDQIPDACDKRLSIGSGTSFSAPVVSGIAAVLAEAFPNATATQIRNALIATGNAGQIEPYFDAVDRGHGLVDAYAAYSLLATGTVPDVLPPFITPWDLSVEDNIEHNAGLVVRSGNVTQTMTDLKPGQRAEILYAVPPNTESVKVRIRNVQMSGPQNPFSGDKLFLYVHSAKTSRGSGDYLVLDPDDPIPPNQATFEGGEPEKEFPLSNPDTGVMRITLNPDTLNAGTVKATVSIETISGSTPSTKIIDGTIENAQLKPYLLTVDPGTTRLDFVLTWDHDWAHYPTADVDLIVCPPTIQVADCRRDGIKGAATLASPERVSIKNPATGTWNLIIHGFNVPTQNRSDNFRLRINAVK